MIAMVCDPERYVGIALVDPMHRRPAHMTCGIGDMFVNESQGEKEEDDNDHRGALVESPRLLVRKTDARDGHEEHSCKKKGTIAVGIAWGIAWELGNRRG